MDAGKCCVAESSVGAGAAAAALPVSDAVSAYVAPRNGGASDPGAAGVLEASGALGSSCTLQYHVWMQANAVS